MKLSKCTFNSHLWHNPNCDILQIPMDSDSFLTFGVYISGIKKDMQFCEYYRGNNYVVGSNSKSYSRMYGVRKIPHVYVAKFENLRNLYNYFMEILENYKVCALWTQEFDSMLIGDISPTLDAIMTKNVFTFICDCENELTASQLDAKQIGHSLWLSQNRHGAGFFDLHLEKEIEDKLMDSAKKLGGMTLYCEGNKVLS